MLLDRVIGLFSHDISIDLGTANTIVLVKGQGVIINEPSVVAVHNDRHGRNKILAVGHEAKEMVGKNARKHFSSASDERWCDCRF